MKAGMAAAQLAGDVRQPPLVYSSRTHSQLTQVIRELRRTSYKCDLLPRSCIADPSAWSASHAFALHCRCTSIAARLLYIGLRKAYELLTVSKRDSVKSSHTPASPAQPRCAPNRHLHAAGRACVSWAQGSRCACTRPCPACPGRRATRPAKPSPPSASAPGALHGLSTSPRILHTVRPSDRLRHPVIWAEVTSKRGLLP